MDIRTVKVMFIDQPVPEVKGQPESVNNMGRALPVRETIP